MQQSLLNADEIKNNPDPLIHNQKRIAITPLPNSIHALIRILKGCCLHKKTVL